MSEYSNFIKGVTLVGIANILISVQGILLLPILTRALGADSYGIWSQLIVSVSLLAPLIGLGLISGVTRFLAAEKDISRIQDGFYSSLVVTFFSGFILILIIWVNSEIISYKIFSDYTINSLVKVFIIIALIESLDRTSLNYFRTKTKMEFYSIFSILQTMGELGLITWAAINGLGLLGAAISLLIIKTLLLVTMLSLIIHDIGIKLPRFSLIIPYFIFGLPLLPSYFLIWIVNSSDLYIIGHYIDNAAVGIYAAAYNIGLVINMFMGPISIVLYPILIRYWEKKEIMEVIKIVEYVMKYFLMLAIPSAFGLSILSKEILTIFTSPEYIKGYLIIPIMAICSIFISFYSLNMHILAILRKTKTIGVLLLFAAVMNIVLNIVLIPRLGIIGAAVSTLMTFIALSVFMYLIVISDIKFGLDLKFILKCLIASCVMCLFILKYNKVSEIDLFIIIGCAAIIYFCLLFTFKAFSKEEIRFAKSILNKGKSKNAIS